MTDGAQIGKQARRGLRVVGGLAKPSTRASYVDAISRRAPAWMPTSKTAERCLVCNAPNPRIRTITSTRGLVRTFAFRQCRRCGHVGNPDNIHDYRKYANSESLPLRPRVGTPERTGREFHMATMAADILERKRLEVLIFGAGRSYDNHHIEALDSVRSVALADIMNVRDDAEFVEIGKPPPRKFSVVIASEVVEHFLEPRKDWAHLLSFVKRDGLVVCSTNVYDGGPIAKQPYIFTSGHVSYYSPEALEILARANGFHLDIRVPWVATGYGGPRKRYLLLSRSREVMDAIPRYFGSRLYAPSEAPDANVVLAEEIDRQREAEAPRRKFG